ncbi:PepSY domain-containing protein [Chelativorans sp. ZYF759]|uniref:PepSY domain-containing protein n=1 Tax=Chelativorans sp. ZYF759 TaxID=2692213 RepID=UPI00145E0F23|nr:PepSY domain-containing protein [Chelativorans sp. ZYF759]NMG38586.1 PepSY domain-containing protein [Chelativorans sp. ZYF759]
MRNALIALSALVFLPTAALAQPPADAMPLSEILASIESEADFSHFDDVDWDDDGYWEIEYYRADGAKVDVDIDPVSGQPR